MAIKASCRTTRSRKHDTSRAVTAESRTQILPLSDDPDHDDMHAVNIGSPLSLARNSAAGRPENSRSRAARQVPIERPTDRPAIHCYYDTHDGKYFPHHPFAADGIANTGDTNSFADIYWEDKLMPYIGGSNEAQECGQCCAT